MTKTTLIYINRADKYLFMCRNKKEKDINKGKFIGVGGHVEKNESIISCLKREVFEETGRNLISFKFKGLILFKNTKFEDEEMYLFTGNIDEGDLAECVEGTFFWINKNEILNLTLWEGDKIFLPYINNETSEKFKLILNYDGDKLLSFEGPIYQDIKVN